MLRDEKPKAKAPQCAVCGGDGINAWWETQLCDGCFRQWQLEAPSLHALELAHADAHPEDVALRGELQFPANGQEQRWVLFSKDVSARIAQRWAMDWLKQAKSRAA
jgi:hypothetical protein